METPPPQLTRELEKSERRQRLVAEFGQLALQRTPLPELLRIAVETVSKGVDAPLVKILRPDSGALLVVAGIGWKPGTVGHACLPMGKRSPPGRTYETGEAVIIHDLPHDPEFDYSDLLREHHVVSVINVPIKNSTVYGVLEVDAGRMMPWGQADLDFLQSFANLLMAAVLRREAEDHRNTLFQELQHRVKNNLQLIAAMLNIYARRSADVRARRDFEDVARRVTIIGSLYQMLMHPEAMGRIDLQAFLEDVCTKLQNISSENGSVAIECKVPKLDASVDEAIPLGLAVNELVVNAVAHAFPETGGRIEIRLEHDAGSRRGTLSIADNGSGMQAQATPGFGLQAVSMLLRQVEGSLTQVPSPAGTAFRIDFRLAAP